MNMLDLYIAEIGKHLPEKNRADLQREIRSLVEDALDDAAQSQGRPVDEAMTVAVLKEFGAPDKVAASYSQPRYLIGPRLFPAYWTVLRIVLAVVMIVTAIGIGLGWGQGANPGQTPVDIITEAIAGLLGALVSVFGNVTLVFTILERFVPDFSLQEKDWDPRQMKTGPDPEIVNLLEPILGSVFTVAALLFLNVYPQWIGLFSIVDGRWESAPLLAPEFFKYVPFINLLLIAGIVRNALLLQSGRWTSALRGLVIATALAGIALLAVMLAGPNLLQLNAADLSRLGWNELTVRNLVDADAALTTLFRSVLGVAIAANLIEIGQQVYALFFRKAAV